MGSLQLTVLFVEMILFLLAAQSFIAVGLLTLNAVLVLLNNMFIPL
jgi:hypothetical protein